MVKGILGALIGAVIGAAVWGGVTYATETQWGILAWAVGGAVGFGAAVMGGRGTSMGIVCAVLALAAIFAGKMFTIHLIAGKIQNQVETTLLSPRLYEEQKKDAAAFAKVSGDEQYRQFMIENGYSAADKPEDVSDEDLREFKNDVMPELVKFTETQPSYEAWKADISKNLSARVHDNQEIAGLVRDNLGVFDILFGLLGLASAFKVGSGRED